MGLPGDWDLVKTAKRMARRRRRRTGVEQQFCMDTLCMPTGNEYHTVKQKCIEAMSSIYSEPVRVLVLDKGLACTNFKSSEALYEIARSIWMCRSWTLPEAMLPKQCLFSFADALFDIDNNRHAELSADHEQWNVSAITERSTADYGIRGRIVHDLLNRGVSGAHAEREVRWTQSPASRVPRFVSVWNALAGRSTTLPGDLYIVLAMCLGFKLKDLHDPEISSGKLSHMLLSLPELPLSLFFLPYSKPLDGNRWLPTDIGPESLTVGSSFASPYLARYWSSKQLQELAVNLREDVRLYVAVEAVYIGRETIMLTDSKSYRILAINLPQQARRQGEPMLVCVSVEQQSRKDISSRRGTIFQVVNDDSSEDSTAGDHHYHLKYHCAVQVFHIDAEGAIPTSDEVAMLTMSEVSRASKISVMFGELHYTTKKLPNADEAEIL